MATITPTRPAPVMQDTREFLLQENRVWASHIVEGSSTLGVRLEIVPRVGRMGEFLTSDDGRTFQRAVFDADYGNLKIIRSGVEGNPDALKTLQRAFKVWRAASGHSDRRAKVRRTCNGLMELLGLPFQTCQTLPYLQVVGSISEASQTAPDDEFQQVEDRLTDLLRSLSETDAGDGEGIINPTRFEQFLNARDE